MYEVTAFATSGTATKIGRDGARASITEDGEGLEVKAWRTKDGRTFYDFSVVRDGNWVTVFSADLTGMCLTFVDKTFDEVMEDESAYQED